MIFILLEIGERNFEYSTLEGVAGVLHTGTTIDEGLSHSTKQVCGQQKSFKSYYYALRDIFYFRDHVSKAEGVQGIHSEVDVLSLGECSWSLDIVPILLCEWVCFFLQAFLSFGKALVLANSHDCDW